MDEKMPCSAPAVNDSRPAAARKTYTVPAGTKVLLQLRSAINTKSAKPGDGVYLASTFPVVVGNRVMIPAGVYVQGTVDRVVRAGRVKGRAELDMHFTSIIFPNGTVVEIPGLVNSLPGASQQQVKDDGEGTIEQAGDKGRNAGKVAEVAVPTGGTVGSIGGLGAGHPVEGGLVGIGAGLAATGLAALFTRGPTSISKVERRWRWSWSGRLFWKKRTWLPPVDRALRPRWSRRPISPSRWKSLAAPTSFARRGNSAAGSDGTCAALPLSSSRV